MEFLRWLLRTRRRLTVTGASMFPILKPDDQILYDRGAYRRRRPRAGDIVVSHHPQGEDFKVIKRVVRIHPDGRLDLQGENPFESTDFNGVDPGKIIGRVTSIFFTN
jgi:phage repressor protein C with HTH and peptisase S24 domain